MVLHRVHTMLWYEEYVGVKFRDSGSKIERNIAKHQICHTLPERSVGTSLWRPKIFIMIKIHDSLYSNFTPTLAFCGT